MNEQRILGAVLENMWDNYEYRCYSKDNNGSIISSAYAGFKIHEIVKNRDTVEPTFEQLTGWPTYAVVWIGNFGIGLDFLPVEI